MSWASHHPPKEAGCDGKIQSFKAGRPMFTSVRQFARNISRKGFNICFVIYKADTVRLVVYQKKSKKMYRTYKTGGHVRLL